MMRSIAGKASRYLRTYGLLTAHFAAARGSRFALMLAAVAAGAVLQPLPFLLAAALVHAVQRGAPALELALGPLQLTIGQNMAVPVVCLVGLGAFLVNYAAAQLANRECLAWQHQLLWELAGRMPRVAMLDRSFDLGVAPTTRNLPPRLLATVRTGFLIGRLVEVGLRDAMLLVLALALLAWLDLEDLLVVLGVSLGFAPLYALLLVALAKVRATTLGRLRAVRALAGGLLRSELGRNPRLDVDRGRLAPPVLGAFGSAYDIGTRQMQKLQAVNLLAGAHALACLYAVYLAEGGRLEGLSADKLLFLVVLLVMLRAVMALVALLSRLTRAYGGLASLRAALFPEAKPRPKGPHPVGTAFRLKVAGHLAPGLPLPRTGLLYLLTPELTQTFHLLPVTNALLPIEPWPATEPASVPLLGLAEAESLLDGRPFPEPAASLVIESVPARLEVPTIGVAVDPARWRAVALIPEATRALARSGRLATLAGERLVIAGLPADAGADGLAADALVVVCDGRTLVAAGNPASILSAYSAELRRWQRRAERLREDDPDLAADDEMPDEV